MPIESLKTFSLLLKYRRNMIALLLHLAGMLITVNSCFGQALPAQETSVCDLIGHPKTYDKKLVRVRAEIVSGTEGAALFDLDNPSCGVTLWIAKYSRDGHDFQALDDALYREKTKRGVARRVFGTFTGIFLRRAKSRKKPVLEAQRVEDISFDLNKFANPPSAGGPDKSSSRTGGPEGKF